MSVLPGNGKVPVYKGTVLFRRGTTAQWTDTSYILRDGEPGWDETIGQMRVGDGVSEWADLPVTSLTQGEMDQLIDLLDDVETTDEFIGVLLDDDDSDTSQGVDERIGTKVVADVADIESQIGAAVYAGYVGKIKGLVAGDSSAPVKANNAAILEDALGSLNSHGVVPGSGVTYYTDPVQLLGNVEIESEAGFSTVLRNNSGSVFLVEGTHLNVGKIYLRSDGGGHTIRQTGGVDQGHWDQVKLWQGGNGYSIWDNDSAGSHYGFVDMRFTRFLSWHTQTATVPSWNLVAAGGTINDNVWEKFRHQFSGNYAFNVESNDVNTQHSNEWRQATWQVTSGGMIRLIGCRNYLIDESTLWDLAAGAVGHTTLKKHGILADTNGSSALCIGTIRNHRRLDSSCDGGIYDIKLPSGTERGSGTILERCQNITSGNPLLLDLNSNYVTVINPSGSASTLSTYANDTNATVIDKAGVRVPSTQVLRTGAGATGSRPSASTMGTGAAWFDTTLGRPVWSNGTSWYDASSSFEEKTGSLVSAAYYGVASGNSAATNTTALSSAITAAATTGAAVRLPAGTISLNDVTATASIIGAGRGKTIVNGGRLTCGAHGLTFADFTWNTSDPYALFASQKDDWTVRNVAVTHTGTVEIAIYSDRVNRLRVFGCKLAVGGMELITTTDFVIDGNYIDAGDANTNEPIHISRQSSGVVTNNTIKNTLTDAIDLYSSGEYCVIANNRFYNLKGASGIEAKVTMSDDPANTSGPGDVIEGVVIANNILRNFIPQSAGAGRAGIYAEYIDSRAVPAFSVAETNRALVITGNVIEDFTLSNPGFSAVYSGIIYTGHNGLITNNVIRHMRSFSGAIPTGISLTAGATGKSIGVRVAGNILVGIESGHGIRTTNVDRSQFDDNIIRADDVNGIETKYGISPTNGSTLNHCSISGNTFACNVAGGNGLVTGSSTTVLNRCRVNNNTFYNCGINLFSTQYCTFVGNVIDNATNSVGLLVGASGISGNWGNVYSSNHVTTSTDAGIGLFDHEDFTVVGNHLKDTSRGVFLSGNTRKGTITGNVSTAQGSGVEFPYFSSVSAADQATIFAGGNVVNGALPFSQPGRIITVSGIDAKTTGTTTLYTVPTGRTAVITGAVVRCTAASAITVAPTLGIGVAAGEDDIFASTAVTGLTATGKEWTFTSSGLAVTAAAAAVIKVGIDTAATGTSQTVAIDLMGYLV